VPGLGRVSADVAWGGNYFGIIDIRGRGLEINPDNAPQLSQIGLAAREMLREKVKLQHPTQGHVSNLNFVTLWHEGRLPGAFYKNVHVFSAGQLDRSPGGTGTSAMMAMFHARGKLGLNQPIQSEGLLGTGVFEGCLIGKAMLGKEPAVCPTIKGRANIIGTARWCIDRDDPVGAGFMVG
jgi:proline racemase